MATILITNDDGVQALGLLALKRSLAAIATVLVLAPERNWSAAGHAKTMHKPLRLHPVTLADGSPAYSSSGGPSDCVAMAAAGILGVVPDLVVSGVNSGYNLGIDITYSGTVACAMEATIMGIPGIAVSSAASGQGDVSMDVVRELAAAVACRVAQQVLARGLPAGTLLNVNVPPVAPEQIKGVHVTRMGNRTYDRNELIERHDPYGRPYYWLGGSAPVDVLDDGTDVGAVRNGYVSVTPISLDMTAHAFLADLESWQLASL
jgi:5'-nucleotidase